MIDHPSRVLPGRADSDGLQVLESCSFRWIFDEATHRFRRTPSAAKLQLDVPAEWSEYHHLEIDDSRCRFLVQLDDTGTRLLRASIHREPCQRCGRCSARSTIDPPRFSRPRS